MHAVTCVCVCPRSTGGVPEGKALKEPAHKDSCQPVLCRSGILVHHIREADHLMTGGRREILGGREGRKEGGVGRKGGREGGREEEAVIYCGTGVNPEVSWGSMTPGHVDVHAHTFCVLITQKRDICVLIVSSSGNEYQIGTVPPKSGRLEIFPLPSTLTSSPGSLLPPEIQSFLVGGGSLGTRLHLRSLSTGSIGKACFRSAT